MLKSDKRQFWRKYYLKSKWLFFWDQTSSDDGPVTSAYLRSTTQRSNVERTAATVNHHIRKILLATIKWRWCNLARRRLGRSGPKWGLVGVVRTLFRVTFGAGTYNCLGGIASQSSWYKFVNFSIIMDLIWSEVMNLGAWSHIRRVVFGLFEDRVWKET